jgi:hypothetical protein
MDLSLNEDQEALREGVARFLAKAASPERVREAEPGGFDAAVWSGLVDMGVPTMSVPGPRAAVGRPWRTWPWSCTSAV